MSVHNKMSLYNVRATEDLSSQAVRFRAITVAGGLVPASLAAGASGRAIGILQSGGRSGEDVTYAYEGIVKCVAGAAISTVGFPIMVGSSGFIFAAASGFAHIGRALSVAATGDLFEANVDFRHLPLWTGV
jgi:hypothetical protein